ncbi:sensor histidine kinase [Ideonella sp. A 288]|uniref:sensor histidine kinase n=1 Tax=Ideonella sp. A 288 TaxID=1962181 RepID=UPI001303BD71|nr:histidine kinase [Ideonella sp. A 288]
MQALNPEIPPLNPLGAPAAASFDDRALMALGIPGFGLSIPWLTGLWGNVRPGDGIFWVGQGLFIGLAAAIWLGNRWLLLKQRQHFDWFSHPLRKLSMLVTANVLYTAPVTVGGLMLWFAAGGMPAPRGTIEVVVLTNVICVLFVTHAYETMFLIRERQSDRLRVERLERLRTQAELGALKAQVDPHFLFNSLNTLGHLITADPPRGRAFCDALAEIYRYVLASRERDLVPLADELAFARVYHQLLAMRFGAAIRLDIDPALDGLAVQIAPLALQTLIENAVKHNQAGEDAPLAITVQPGDGSVRVGNAVLPRRSRLPSAGLGLANLDERCRWLTGRSLRRDDDGQRFEVDVPVVP